MTTLTLIRGISGSGKSTIAQQLLIDRDRKIVHFEADHYFIDQDGTYRFDPDKLQSAHEWCLNSTKMHLQNGFDVIVSNTFTTQKECSPYIEFAQENGYNLQIITVQGDFNSIHDVPESTLEKMRNRFVYKLEI